MTVELREPTQLPSAESTPGIVRQPIFETETAVMARSHIESGTTTGWHHHGERDAYGHLLAGEATIEYGPGGRTSDHQEAPAFFHVGAGTVHRETVTGDADATVVVTFVGSGPVVTNVEGPAIE